MKTNSILSFTLILTLGLFIFSCTPKDKDDEYPVIDMSGDAFPQNCDTIYRGERFAFKATFTDNVELGGYSINIHHNFDHHNHSSYDEECEMDAVKDPVNPFVLIEAFSIPSGSTSYIAADSILVPAGVDTGDYHFQIQLTDKEGWQEILGISIKIKDRANN